MNILVSSSRGAGLPERMDLGPYPLRSDIKGGGKLKQLSQMALALLPPPHRYKHTTHVYILAGIPDLTEKLYSKHPYYNYTESIFTEDPEQAIHRMKQEINTCAKTITDAGATPCFATITSCDIHKYNQTLLKDNKTSELLHKNYYEDMQTRLHTTIEEVNKYIAQTNREHNMSTPFCHTAIKKRSGKGTDAHYTYRYSLLYDGVHGKNSTKRDWARTLANAIRLNRQQSESSTEDEAHSPKRSWAREKRQRLD